MIEYSNITRYDKLDFDEYVQMPGLSFSYLKGERYGQGRDVKITDKIRIGKMVDAILTEDGFVDMEADIYPIAKSIAGHIKQKFGDYLHRFTKQVSFSGDACYNGYKMHTRGRLDYLFEGIAVIDLKVTHESANKIRPLIKHMCYDDQLWNYARLAGVKKKYIMIHSVPSKTTEMIDMGVVTNWSEFWQTKIEKFGKPVADGNLEEA